MLTTFSDPDIPLVGFDLETTGLNPETDRIVTAALVYDALPNTRRTRTWLVNPGVPIPEEAAAIHGVTTELAMANGEPAVTALEDIAATLAHSANYGPWVIMNAPFDLTLLHRELLRNGLPTLEQRMDCEIGPVLDPRVIDQYADKYRPGRRTLEDLAAYYGIELVDAHQADADALGAVLVTRAMGSFIPSPHQHRRTAYATVQRMLIEDLHKKQKLWAAAQAIEYQTYRRRITGDHTLTISQEWPVKPLISAQRKAVA